MQNKTVDYSIKNTQIFRFKDGKYCVCLQTKGGWERFYGTREVVLKKMALRVKRILHVR